MNPNESARHTDALILWALDKAINRRMSVSRTYVDKNMVDAFTANLMDAGVDMSKLDCLFDEADIVVEDEA